VGGAPDHPSRTIIRSSTFLSNTSTFDPPGGGAVHAHQSGSTSLCDAVFSNNAPTDYLATGGATISVAKSCACEGDVNGC
jgi:predicted outer membrane repeat protein